MTKALFPSSMALLNRTLADGEAGAAAPAGAGSESARRDDAAGDRPGSERGDAEEALFMASLSASDRAYLEGRKGLGNSQKAEVAWLEREGIPYEEVDVRQYAPS